MSEPVISNRGRILLLRPADYSLSTAHAFSVLVRLSTVGCSGEELALTNPKAYTLWMPSVAEQLRLAREHRKLSIQQVADEMKVRADQIRALEAGQYDTFPAAVYVRGFVRTYAGIVKLSVPDTISSLEQELAEIPQFNEGIGAVRPQPPTLGARFLFGISRMNWTVALAVLGIAVLLILSVVGYRSWRGHKESDQHLDLGSGLFEPTSSNQNRPGRLPLPQK